MELTHKQVLDRYHSRLLAGLEKQRTKMRMYQQYYDGAQPITFSTDKYRHTFKQFLEQVTDNWMPIIVDAVAERMRIQGFRFDVSADSDTDAQDIWQRNGMDAESELLHNEMLVCGIGYVMVWGCKMDGQDMAMITVENPSQVYVAPGSCRNERVAAIKCWTEEWDADADDGVERMNIYLPDFIYKFAKDKGGNWSIWTDPDEREPNPLPNPLGMVPIVPFYNRPTTEPGSYKSELAEAISTQDQINKLVIDALVASEFAAYRQRWAVGVEIELDENGQPKNPFQADINRLWTTENADAKFGSFDASDLSNYVALVENRIQSLASRTRTPAHYLLGNSGTFPSGESLKATETGLIAKVKSRCQRTGEAWEEVMRLAFLAQGDDKRGTYYRAETMWADPESRTESEHVDALVKLRTIGVPLKQLWRDRGYSEEEIASFADMRMDEALESFMSSSGPATPKSPMVPQSPMMSGGMPDGSSTPPGNSGMDGQPTAIGQPSS